MTRSAESCGTCQEADLVSRTPSETCNGFNICINTRKLVAIRLWSHMKFASRHGSQISRTVASQSAPHIIFYLRFSIYVKPSLAINLPRWLLIGEATCITIRYALVDKSRFLIIHSSLGAQNTGPPEKP